MSKSDTHPARFFIGLASIKPTTSDYRLQKAFVKPVTKYPRSHLIIPQEDGQRRRDGEIPESFRHDTRTHNQAAKLKSQAKSRSIFQRVHTGASGRPSWVGTRRFCLLGAIISVPKFCINSRSTGHCHRLWSPINRSGTSATNVVFQGRSTSFTQRRSTFCRKARGNHAVCNAHDFGAFAAFGLPDQTPPFLAEQTFRPQNILSNPITRFSEVLG